MIRLTSCRIIRGRGQQQRNVEHPGAVVRLPWELLLEVLRREDMES